MCRRRPLWLRSCQLQPQPQRAAPRCSVSQGATHAAIVMLFLGWPHQPSPPPPLIRCRHSSALVSAHSVTVVGSSVQIYCRAHLRPERAKCTVSFLEVKLFLTRAAVTGKPTTLLQKLQKTCRSPGTMEGFCVSKIVHVCCICPR